MFLIQLQPRFEISTEHIAHILLSHLMYTILFLSYLFFFPTFNMQRWKTNLKKKKKYNVRLMLIFLLTIETAHT